MFPIFFVFLIFSLEELHLSFNQMDIPLGRVEKDVQFPKVLALHFDGNRVEHRDHLHWISQNFPSLKSLVLCDCPLWTLRRTSAAPNEVIYFVYVHSNHLHTLYFILFQYRWKDCLVLLLGHTAVARKTR